MGERKSALLTSSQREFLFNQQETDNAAHDRAMRSRLRNRVYDGLLDGALVWQWLDADDREQIFETWQEAGDEIEYVDEGVWGDVMPEYDRRAERERERFEHALVSLIAFVYTGAHESGHLDVESIVTDGVATAEHAMGNQVRVSLEYADLFDLDELRKRYEKEDSTLTVRELQYLEQQGEITAEERDEFFQTAVDDLDDVATWFGGPMGESFDSDESDDIEE